MSLCYFFVWELTVFVDFYNTPSLEFSQSGGKIKIWNFSFTCLVAAASSWKNHNPFEVIFKTNTRIFHLRITVSCFMMDIKNSFFSGLLWLREVHAELIRSFPSYSHLTTGLTGSQFFASVLSKKLLVLKFIDFVEKTCFFDQTGRITDQILDHIFIWSQRDIQLEEDIDWLKGYSFQRSKHVFQNIFYTF